MEQATNYQKSAKLLELKGDEELPAIRRKYK